MMKILIFLALLFSAFADHHEGHDPCLEQCRNKVKTKMGTEFAYSHLTPEYLESTEGRTKIRAFLKGYIDGNASIPHAIGDPDHWVKLCTIATESETCVNLCPESPKRENVKKYINLFKLTCDADFKSVISCLIDVNKMPSETCRTKCTPLAAKLKEYIAQRERETDTSVRVHAPKDVLESGCKFVNCRLNCRKADIVGKCQEKGFEQAKKLTSTVAQWAKMLYKRAGGDSTNWPDACEGVKIIEAREY